MLRCKLINNTNNIEFSRNIKNYKKNSNATKILNCSESQAVKPPSDDIDKLKIGSLEWKIKTTFKILLFALPALAIPLADPLLSLVDTWCVAQVI